MKIEKIETNLKRNLYLKSSLVEPSLVNKTPENQVVRINPELTFQEFLGFGGALTESSCYLLSKLKPEIRNQILEEYFAKDKLNYQFARLSIGSCDFSLNSYSYSYENDLSDFSIERDNKCVIPIIQLAQKQNPSLKFLASPWSPPAFMKDNHHLYRGGKLLPKYRELWCNYLVSYVKSYSKYGIPITYMTIQNEPQAKQIWESCLYSSSEEAELLKNYLFPIFQKNNLSTEFFIWDHNKDRILERNIETLIDYHALSFTKGIAFHWYTGGHFDSLERLAHLFPTLLLFHTEGCTGYSHFKPQDELSNSEMYAYEIIEDFNHGTNAFIDWNIVLDYKGGPNHVKNYCNSLIMLTKKNDNFIKTPAFYYVSHFAKFMKPKAKRIHVNKFSENISTVAFKNPDKSVMIVLLNKTDKNIEYNLCYQDFVFHDNLDSHAIVTLIYQDK